MDVLDAQPVLDGFPADQAVSGQAAVLGPIIGSNGGYYNIANNPVYAQYAYVDQGHPSQSEVRWGEPVPIPVGPANLLPGTVGVRFKNYTPGVPAIVSGSLAERWEPAVQITSGGVSTPGAGTALQVISDQKLAAPAATIDFPNIAQTFAHLLLLASVRADPVAASVNMALRVNGDAAADYADQNMQAAGAAVTAALNDPDSGGFFVGPCVAASGPNGSFSVVEMRFYDYASTVNLKTATVFVTGRRTAGTGFPVQLGGGQEISALTAINRLTLFPASGNFVAGSRATLYGMLGS